MSWILLVENAEEHTELAQSLRDDGHRVTEVASREHLNALRQATQRLG